MTSYGAIEAMNWSRLSALATSPRLFAWRREHPREDTASMQLGRLVHTMVLEPDQLDSRYAVQPPGMSLATKAGKAWARAHVVAGVEKVTASQYDTARLCAESVAMHPVASDLLAGAATEVVLQWTDEETGVHCKGRSDAIGGKRLADLKTCRECESFTREAWDLLYRAQIAFYLDGAIQSHALPRDAEVWLIAVETSPPYDCRADILPHWMIQDGRLLYRRLLRQYLACEEAGMWPGAYPGAGELDAPWWAKYEVDRVEGSDF